MRIWNRGVSATRSGVVSKIREGSQSEAEALTIRGLAEADLDEVGAARRDLERAWQLRPNAAAARVLAAIYLSACENERGFQMLMNAARIEPQDFRPWYAMGELVYLRLRRYEQAIGAFGEALKRSPGHLESRIGLVEALVKPTAPRRPSRSSRACWRRVPMIRGSRRSPPRSPWNSAMTRMPNASSQRSLTIDPDRREALILQARLKVRQGRPRDALAVAERVCALEPNDPAALGLLASIQAHRRPEGRGRPDATAAPPGGGVEPADRGSPAHDPGEARRPGPACRLGQAAAGAGQKDTGHPELSGGSRARPRLSTGSPGAGDLGVSGPKAPPARR